MVLQEVETRKECRRRATAACAALAVTELCSAGCAALAVTEPRTAKPRQAASSWHWEERSGHIARVSGGAEAVHETKRPERPASSWHLGGESPGASRRLPSAGDHASAAIGGKLYVFGGFSGEEHRMASVEAYDPISNAWAQLSDLTSARDEFVAVAL